MLHERFFARCADGAVTEIQRMIETHPELLSLKTEAGLSPLAEAARNGKLKLCEYFLEQGISPCQKDMWQRTALFYAATLPVWNLLLKHGCSTEEKDTMGFTPLTWKLALLQEDAYDFYHAAGLYENRDSFCDFVRAEYYKKIAVSA